MVNITSSPVQVGDSYSTKYNGQATPTATDFIFSSVQDSIIVTNYGISSYITATSGGESVRIQPNGGTYRFKTDSDTVNIKSSYGATNPITIEGRSFASGQGGGAGIDTTARADIQSFNAKLADTVRDAMVAKDSKRRPLVTFTLDDGLSADLTITKPIFLSYNVPCVTALITKDLNNIQERLDLQNNNGWEITSHSVNHVYLDSLSDTDLDFELKQSKQDLENAGFKVDGIIYPYGAHNAATRRIGKKYYKYGAEMGYYPINKGVIPSFAIARTGLGSVYDNIGGVDQNTLAYYKSKVDEAVANNGWCVFMLHPGNTGFNATQQGYLAQVIEYVKSLNVDIVTLRDGWEVFGNSLEVGDYTLKSNDGIAFSRTGEIGNKIPKLIKNTGLNNASLVTAFPTYCMSMTTYLNADSGGFPTSAGTLITSRLHANDDLSYQLWMPYDSNTLYKRRWVTNVWGAWQIIAGTQTSWAGVVTTNTNWNKVGTVTASNYINFVTWFSTGGNQPALTKNTWALTEISADSANPTVIGTVSGVNVQAYKDANGGIYVKYSGVGNNYSSFLNVAFS